jgi:hypothetical protein
MIATKTVIKWIRPVQLVTTLAVCMILVLICQVIVLEISQSQARRIFERRRSRSVAVSEADRTQREFLFDGTVVLVRQTMDPTTGRVKAIWVAEPNNHTLYDGPPDQNPYALISWGREGAQSSQANTPLREMNRYCGLLAGFSRVVCVRTVAPDLQHSVTWVYEPDLGAFAGYNLDGHVVGYLGGQGLDLRRQETHPLDKGLSLIRLKRPDSANLLGLWVATHSVYLIDFDAVTVTQVFHSNDGSIQWARANHWDDSNTSPYLPSVTIVMEDGRTSVYLPDSHKLIPLATPSDPLWQSSPVLATQRGLYLRRDRIVGAPSYRDREAYLQWWQQNRNQPLHRIMQLLQVQDNGDLKPISSFEWTQPTRADASALSQARWESRINYAIGVVSPLPIRYIPDQFKHPRGRYQYLRFLIEPFISAPIYVPANLVATLALAALTFVHARPRRTGWGGLVFWLVLVLVLNLAGFLTYLALNHTPVIRCPACGRCRGLMRPDCPACQALPPPPKARTTDLILSTA